ncbi:MULTISPECIES: PcfJ domain-containing protein [Sphingobacterium]|uniref:PcfJ domain-containing protein n=1 Tax=Sphingobacterium TaxID=28453 RepID=UPI00104469F7
MILVAYRNGEILETIEISLKDYRILQSRGRNNKETKEHDKIISIVNENIDKIKYIKAS